MLCRHAVSSVRLSVMFVRSVKTSNRIKNFSPPGSHTMLVIPHQTSRQYYDGEPPYNGGVECSWGRHKSRLSTNSWLSIDDCCSANKCGRRPCSLSHRWRRISVLPTVPQTRHLGVVVCADLSPTAHIADTATKVHLYHVMISDYNRLKTCIALSIKIYLVGCRFSVCPPASRQHATRH